MRVDGKTAPHLPLQLHQYGRAALRLQHRNRPSLIGAMVEVRQQLRCLEGIGYIGSQPRQYQHSARPVHLAMNPNQFADHRTRHAQHTVQHEHDFGDLVLLDQEIEVLAELLDVVVFRQLIPVDGDNVDFAETYDGEESRVKLGGVRHGSARR